MTATDPEVPDMPRRDDPPAPAPDPPVEPGPELPLEVPDDPGNPLRRPDPEPADE